MAAFLIVSICAAGLCWLIQLLAAIFSYEHRVPALITMSGLTLAIVAMSVALGVGV